MIELDVMLTDRISTNDSFDDSEFGLLQIDIAPHVYQIGMHIRTIWPNGFDAAT